MNWHCFGGKVKLGLRVGQDGHWVSIPANVAKSESFGALLSGLPRDTLVEPPTWMCRPRLFPVEAETDEPVRRFGFGSGLDSSA